jgi:AraC family transcriptional regulator
VVPLLPGRPIRDSTQSPWSGVYIEEHNLGAVFIPEHEHATFLLHLQLNELVRMDWHSSGRTGRQITGAGNLIFLTPGTRDHLLFHGPSRRIVISVDPALIRQRADDLELKCVPEFDNRWAFQDEQLRLLISEMEREMSSGWAMGSLYGDSLSTAFTIALVKKCGEAVLGSPQFKGGLSPSRLRRVLSYMHENFRRDIRLSELANIAGLSDYHFARSFRQTTGATPHQYLSQIRINHAKSLLLRRHWTVLQIAGAVGFADASRLSKVFRANTGVSPAEWRRGA